MFHFFAWLEKEHPVLYEILMWVPIVLSIAALLKS